MGAEPYWYVVDYEADADAALQRLRRREFLAGRYNPVMPFIDFPITPASPAPGNGHGSIEEAMEDAEADGARSILDIDRVAFTPDFRAATALPEGVLRELYGTARPTRSAVEADMSFLEEVERGRAVYLTLYRDGKPDELMFAGYSFD